MSREAEESVAASASLRSTPKDHAESIAVDEILAQLHGQTVLSLNGKIRYDVEVIPGQRVKLSHSGRKVPAVLNWKTIESVYKAACDGMEINIKNADSIMGDARDRNASAVCALVMAMRELSVT